MKKYLSLFLTLAMLLPVCAGTVSAAPKKNVIKMTVPSSYGYVYDRLDEVFGKEPVFVPVDEEIIEEAPVEEAVVEEAPAMEAAAVQPGGGSDDYSKTNVQVEGIDEGDIVKTDGEYIYVLKRKTDELLILEADGKNTSLLSAKELNSGYTIQSDKYNKNWYDGNDVRHETLSEEPSELYISGDRAAVVLTCYHSTETRENGVWKSDYEEYTLLKIYDISDPEKPLHTASLGQSGNYETSRMIGDTVYLLTEFRPTLGDREAVEDYIPSLYRNSKKEAVPVKSMILPPEMQSMRYTVITGYDLTKQESASTKSILTQTDTVYMNGDHLYLADQRSCKDVSEPRKESVYTVTETVSGHCTDIYKFALGEKIVTKAFCTVDGKLLNQFSMDEYKGNLRLVTTHSTNTRITYTDEAYGFSNSKRIASEQTNGLYVYDENLNLLGSVTGLAKDERVYSVRFDGDVGYFVTFRQIDPLFAVDLSNPRKPEIMSALKIPGFSEYLHPYGDGLLFGLGQNATLSGWTTGL